MDRMAKSIMSRLHLRDSLKRFNELRIVKQLSVVTTRRKVTLWAAFSACFIVFLINFILAILAHTRLDRIGPDNYIRTLYSGSCTTVKRTGVVAHLIINVLSTLMLWASNLGLQLVGSPTRKMINQAHAKHTWLDIGIVSFRNLWSIPRMSLVVWLVLAFSSLPIHFLYNSVIFSTLHTNSYKLHVVTEQFLQRGFTVETITGGAPLSQSSEYYNVSLGKPHFVPGIISLLDHYHLRHEPFQNASILNCLQSYNDPFQYRPNLFMVTHQLNYSNLYAPYDTDNLNRTFLDQKVLEPFDTSNFEPAGLCQIAPGEFQDQGFCSRLSSLTPEEAEQYSLRGFPWHIPIDYCLVDLSTTSENFKAQHECHLQCSPLMLLIVTLFNALKCLCILYIIFRAEARGIATVGDAIASFLENPDISTKQFGVTTKRAIYHSRKKPIQRTGTAIVWRRKAERWWTAADAGSLTMSLLFLLLTLTAAAWNIGDGIYVQKKYKRNASLSGLWSMGFGNARSETMVTWNQPMDGITGLFVNLVIANMWQILVSILYMSFTAVLTSQLIAREWTTYGRKRRGLRVSKPKGEQRGTYFLSVPFRYGIPIQVVFILEHWLLSQSTFIVRLIHFDWDGTPLPGHTTTGYSIIAGLSALILTIVIFSSYTALGIFRRYPERPAMPLVSTNSLAISANCHPPKEDRGAHLKKVQWGIYTTKQEDSAGPKRCSLTSLDVEPVEYGVEIYGLVEGKYQDGHQREASRELS